MTLHGSKKGMVIPVSRLLYCAQSGHLFSSLAGPKQLFKRSILKAHEGKVGELSTKIVRTCFINKYPLHLLLQLDLVILCGDKPIGLCSRTPCPDGSRMQFSIQY